MRRVTPENKVSRRKLPSVSIIHILEKGKTEDLWEAKLCSSLLHTLSSRIHDQAVHLPCHAAALASLRGIADICQILFDTQLLYTVHSGEANDTGDKRTSSASSTPTDARN